MWGINYITLEKRLQTFEYGVSTGACAQDQETRYNVPFEQAVEACAENIKKQQNT